MNIKKNTLLLLIAILFGGNIVSAQIKMDFTDRVNKYISLEIGPKINIRTTPDTLSGTGLGVMLDYGWQVSGFKGNRRRSYISVPLGYGNIVDNKNRENAYMLNYGWAVTHELSKDSNNVPFIGYGLLLNQYRFHGIKGSIFGHQSRFEIGINHYISTKWVAYWKFDYSYIRFPSLYESKSRAIHQLEVKFGARFLF